MATKTNPDIDALYDKQIDPGPVLQPESFRKESALHKASHELTPFDLAVEPEAAGIFAVTGTIFVRAEDEFGAKERFEALFGPGVVPTLEFRPATQKDYDDQRKLVEESRQEKEERSAREAAERQAEKEQAETNRKAS
jgi:hypothetical protein